MTFDITAIKDLYSAVESHALSLNLFQRVNSYEPDNAPGGGLSCAILLGPLAPARGASGLAATSGRLEFAIRLYSSRLQKPLNGVDPAILDAAGQLMAAYSGDLTLGGSVMVVDLLGSYGTALSTSPGYLEQDGSLFRTQDITLPIVIDDLWGQGVTDA